MKKISIIVGFIFLLGLISLGFLLYCGINDITLFTFKNNRANSYGSTDSKQLAKELFNLANKERKISPKRLDWKLEWNDCLSEKAVERAGLIEETGQFDHKSENGDYPYRSMVNSCYLNGFQFAGENLSSGSLNILNANIIHKYFMDSQSHRDNILSGDFTEMGAGCHGNICVEFFGTPMDNSPEVKAESTEIKNQNYTDQPISLENPKEQDDDFDLEQFCEDLNEKYNENIEENKNNYIPLPTVEYEPITTPERIEHKPFNLHLEEPNIPYSPGACDSSAAPNIPYCNP